MFTKVKQWYISKRDECLANLDSEFHSEYYSIYFPSRWKRMVYGINHQTLIDWFGGHPRDEGYKPCYPWNKEDCKQFNLTDWQLYSDGIHWHRGDMYCMECSKRNNELTLGHECDWCEGEEG